MGPSINGTYLTNPAAAFIERVHCKHTEGQLGGPLIQTDTAVNFKCLDVTIDAEIHYNMPSPGRR